MRIRVTQVATGHISVHALQAPRLTVGRAATNDVVIPDPRIGRRHGRFASEAARVTYEHLGSQSPSRLRRNARVRAIAGRTPLALRHGDELLLGQPSPIVRIDVDLGQGAEGSVEDVAVDLALPATSESVSRLTGELDRAALRVLHRYAMETARLRDVASVAQAFADRVLEAFPGATHVSVFLAGTGERHFEPFLALDREGPVALAPPSCTLSRLVTESGRAVRFHSGELAVQTSESLQLAGVRSGLCAPLWNGERIIGLVQIDRRGRISHTFGRRDLELLTIFAHQLALGVESTALTEELHITVHRLQRARAELEQLAFTDPLTGLPNRRLFRDRLDQAIRRAERTGAGFALMYVDLDRFKAVNDGFGHDSGDMAIATVGARLLECVRRQDTVARIGGDEFAVLLADVGEISGALTVADKIRAQVNLPIDLAPAGGAPPGAVQVHVTASIGVVLADDGLGAEELLQRVDRALYRAKSDRDASAVC